MVFGDFGASPLDTMRECLLHLPTVERTPEVLGVLSLMFCALTCEASFNCPTFVTRAANRGEGGIVALPRCFFQPRGTKAIGAWFGPVMLVRLVTIAAPGVPVGAGATIFCFNRGE